MDFIDPKLGNYSAAAALNGIKKDSLDLLKKSNIKCNIKCINKQCSSES